MAGLIRELLLDYALNKVSIELKSDLNVAIDTTFLSDVFTYKDLTYFSLFLSGYTSEDIAKMAADNIDHVEATLERIFMAIETNSGYTDENFIRKMERTKKYRPYGINKLKDFLAEHSKHYTTHELT